MPQALLFVNPDGSVVTTVFTHDDEDLIQRDIAELKRPGASSAQPDAQVRRFSSHEECARVLPPKEHRYFRSCWRWQGSRVGVDLPLARAQRLTELRRERDVALAATDGIILRDQEQGKDVSVLLAKRQALRDMPVTAQGELSALSSPDAIKSYVPGVLR